MNEEFERGIKEGELRATVASHTEHLARINGSIDRFTVSSDLQTEAVRSGFEVLRSEILGMKVEARLAEERAIAATDALHEDAAKRQARFTRRVKAVGIATPFLTGAAGYFSHILGLG